jgi:predicted RND superfamily exporter protein
MNIPFLGRVDERFLEHRRRSTSMGSMAGALVAGGLYFYRLIAQHVISWDLFAVLLAMAVVKMSFMVYYRTRD